MTGAWIITMITVLCAFAYGMYIGKKDEQEKDKK